MYLDVFEKLQEFDTRYNLNMFKLWTRLSSKNKERWDSNFIQQHLYNERKSITKFFLVGPVPFMDDMKEAILQAGVACEEQIILV